MSLERRYKGVVYQAVEDDLLELPVYQADSMRQIAEYFGMTEKAVYKRFEKESVFRTKRGNTAKVIKIYVGRDDEECLD